MCPILFHRSIASNELVTSRGIDACYDVVRLENITESSLNVLPTPSCSIVKVCIYAWEVTNNHVLENRYMCVMFSNYMYMGQYTYTPATIN